MIETTDLFVETLGVMFAEHFVIFFIEKNMKTKQAIVTFKKMKSRNCHQCDTSKTLVKIAKKVINNKDVDQ